MFELCMAYLHMYIFCLVKSFLNSIQLSYYVFGYTYSYVMTSTAVLALIW